jgi:GNAT superfamily N-acetyltransferase
MEFAITPLAPHQIEETAQFFHDIWHETQAPLQDALIAAFRGIEHFRCRVETRAERTLLAHIGDRLAGFTTWTDDVLNSLYVDMEFRGQNVGDRLCCEAEGRMQDDGRSLLKLYCVNGNFAARKFYERRGWRLLETVDLEIETHAGQRLAAHWMMVKGRSV